MAARTSGPLLQSDGACAFEFCFRSNASVIRRTFSGGAADSASGIFPIKNRPARSGMGFAWKIVGAGNRQSQISAAGFAGRNLKIELKIIGSGRHSFRTRTIYLRRTTGRRSVFETMSKRIKIWFKRIGVGCGSTRADWLADDYHRAALLHRHAAAVAGRRFGFATETGKARR